MHIFKTATHVHKLYNNIILQVTYATMLCMQPDDVFIAKMIVINDPQTRF